MKKKIDNKTNDLVSMFRIGQPVTYITKGAVGGVGAIVKLHHSGRNGSAEIRTNGKKITRRLQFVIPRDIMRTA